jgi:hypothetical protein
VPVHIRVIDLKEKLLRQVSLGLSSVVWFLTPDKSPKDNNKHTLTYLVDCVTGGRYSCRTRVPHLAVGGQSDNSVSSHPLPDSAAVHEHCWQDQTVLPRTGYSLHYHSTRVC